MIRRVHLEHDSRAPIKTTWFRVRLFLLQVNFLDASHRA